MQYSRILIVLMTLVMGALAAPIPNTPTTRDAAVSFGDPYKVWFRGDSMRLDFEDKSGHDDACKDSEYCNIKFTTGDFKYIDEDWGNPDLVTYEADITPKRIRFNYGSADKNWCGDHYLCYLNVEVAPRP